MIQSFVEETKLDGYEFCHFRSCPNRDEIFDGIFDESDIDECKKICDKNDSCVSFEYWGQGNPHGTLGEGVCHVSSSCTFELSVQKDKLGKGPNSNLYIKSKYYLCSPLE